MSYVKLGSDRLVMAAPTTSTSKCPDGQVYDEIEQMCYTPEKPKATAPLLTLRQQYELQSSSTKTTSSTTTSPTRTYEGDHTISTKPQPEPEDITEDGYSEPVPEKPAPAPIPESDGADAGGAQTVDRTSPGSGGGTPYNPATSPKAPAEPLAPISLPQEPGPSRFGQALEKTGNLIADYPLVAIGVGAAAAYLIFKRRR